MIDTKPLVIAHRGAPGIRLEHTADSYLAAIEMGVDYIEPDVVATRDGVLVVRHENEIATTTDVADHPEFADRRAVKVIDGVELDGWFTEDFTWAELSTLRCRERIPQVRPHNTALDGTVPMLRFDDVLDIAEAHDVPVYVETKHPTHFDSLGLDLNALLIEALERRGRTSRSSDDVIQSFETANLRKLRGMTDLPLIFLMEKAGAPADLVAAGDPRTYRALTTPENLAWVAQFVDGIGPHKGLVIDPANWPSPTSLVADAHAAGLLVHPWTLRDEASFRPAGVSAIDECLAFFDAGVDGVFSDLGETALTARRAWTAGLGA